MVRMGKKFFVFYVILCIYAFSNNVKKIRSGESHTLILLGNGKVFGFGWNESGQVINGNSKNYKKIVEIKGVESIVDIDVGDIHSVALRKDGIVFTWGSDFSGQLGSPDYKNFHLPVIVKMKNGEILKDIIKVAAGWDFSVALKKDGTVWTWGENKYGQLGDGTYKNKYYPVCVKGPKGIGYLQNIVDIKAGAYHVLALSKDGTVWAWGDNQFGQLGDGSFISKKYPVKVKNFSGNGELSDIVKIECGAFHSCAINKNGEVLMWGKNMKGQLGNGTYEDRNLPVFVKNEEGKGHLKEIVDISLGRNHTIALNKNGEIFVWGSNKYGQLGNEILKSSPFPIRVYLNGKPLNKIVKISAGGAFNVVLNQNGELYFWGTNIVLIKGREINPSPLKIAKF